MNPGTTLLVVFDLLQGNGSWPDPRAFSMGRRFGSRGRRIRRILRPRLFNDVHVGLSKGIGVKHVAEEPGSAG